MVEAMMKLLVKKSKYGVTASHDTEFHDPATPSNSFEIEGRAFRSKASLVMFSGDFPKTLALIQTTGLFYARLFGH